MSKLYQVEITVLAVVAADDETHAWQVADSYKRDIMSDDPDPCIEVDVEVKKLADMRHGWDGECIPYGGDGNTRIGAILAAQQSDGGQS